MKLCNALVDNITYSVDHNIILHMSQTVTLSWHVQNFIVIGWAHLNQNTANFDRISNYMSLCKSLFSPGPNDLKLVWWHQTSNISCTLVGNKIVDYSDVVGALPVGTAPATSSFWTKHLASMNLGKDNVCMMRPETFRFWNLLNLIIY